MNMVKSLHMANDTSSSNFCQWHNDAKSIGWYKANMPQRRRDHRHLNWYLPEWLASKHMRQTDLIELTGWSKTTASLLVNGKQDYSPKLVDEAAAALQIAVFELFLPPDTAHALKRLRTDSVRIASDIKLEYLAEPNFGAATGTNG